MPGNVEAVTVDLRSELDRRGISRFDVQLPGETDVPPLEGALTLEPRGDGWILATLDYGTHWALATAPDEAGAAQALLTYIDRPLPPAMVLSEQKLDELAATLSTHYFDLRDRATEAGDAGILIDIPPGVLVDRIGALDGIHLYPLDTPFELRSLPPSALRPENDVHRFLTWRSIRVRAAITPPWFGRPGGGLRFTLQAPERGIRDLVIGDALRRFERVS
jgi:hypothetical protein